MQGADDLLGHRLDRYGPDLLVAEGLEQPLHVGAVGLVPHHVGSDVLRRQKDHDVAEFLDPSPPVVSRTTGLHHDGRRWQLGEELQEPTAVKPPPPGHPARSLGPAQFEHFLCDVDRYQSIVLHDGLLLLPSPRSDFGTSMPIKSQEESISSLKLTKPGRLRSFAA
jgi:hypothetical protein